MSTAPPLPLAAEFDRTMEAERARWLRRRLSGEGLPPADWPAALLRGVAGHHEGPTEDDMLVVSLYRPAVPVQPAVSKPVVAGRGEPVPV